MASAREKQEVSAVTQLDCKILQYWQPLGGETLGLVSKIVPSISYDNISQNGSEPDDEEVSNTQPSKCQKATSDNCAQGLSNAKFEKPEEVVSTVATKSNILHESDMFDSAFASDWQLKKSKTTDSKQLASNISSLRLFEDSAAEQIKSSVDVQQFCDEAPYMAMSIGYGGVYAHPTWFYPQITQEMLWLPSMNCASANILRFLYNGRLSLNETYNLFSNFGNIQKIVKKSTKYFVVFTSDGFAQAAKEHLNGLTLFSHKLTIEDAHPDEIVEKAREYSQSISYDPSHDRFNLSKPLSINPPSIVLHLSNLKKDTCTESRLRKLFEQFGKIERIQLLLNIKDKWMALIRFSTLEESLNATTALHNLELSGRRMHISFTKSKI